MRDFPITKYEAYLRLSIAYLPLVLPPLYFDDERGWLYPILYFITFAWGIPLIAFTSDRTETEEANKILKNGFMPLLKLMIWGLGLSAILFVFFGSPRY